MPTESAPPERPHPGPSFPSQPSIIKCTLCGAGGITTSPNDGVVVLVEPIERICGVCVRASELSSPEMDRVDEGIGLGLSLVGVQLDENRSRFDRSIQEDDRRTETPSPLPLPPPPPTLPHAVPIPLSAALPIIPSFHSQSLPSQHTRPWTTATPNIPTVPEHRPLWPATPTTARVDEVERPPNPVLDVTQARLPSIGRGALYAGSVFKGTQTSGRSAYEVEVRLLDVNFPESTLSGYLSISHLTDAHPHLTTFFTGEIIGPKHGFLTGTRFGATEHDDMRHWGRFEQFRRPATRGDIIRPDMVLRDPLPDRNRGEVRGKERDFCFLRLKERFLVPDHTVRDISGASFAGFYYAMVDFSPSAPVAEPPLSPTSPTQPKSPILASPTTNTTRLASLANDGRPQRPERRRRESSTRDVRPESKPEATIRGYYFHSLNQEPFQELFLSHVPNRSCSTFEMR